MTVPVLVKSVASFISPRKSGISIETASQGLTANCEAYGFHRVPHERIAGVAACGNINSPGLSISRKLWRIIDRHPWKWFKTSFIHALIDSRSNNYKPDKEDATNNPEGKYSIPTLTYTLLLKPCQSIESRTRDRCANHKLLTVLIDTTRSEKLYRGLDETGEKKGEENKW